MHYCAPGLQVRPLPRKNGLGVFALRPFAAAELLAVWGGRIITEEQLLMLPEPDRWYVLQVEDDLHLATDLNEVGAADYINHSCEPNAGMEGQISLVALRAIAAGEEICFDYAMAEGCAALEFDCACGSPLCRGRLRADDWRRPELQRRYRGHFSPFLQRRIDTLAATQTPRKQVAGRRR